MKATLILFTIAALGIKAINLDAILRLQEKSGVISKDGPTNGEMTEEEKDSLIQVLCPGNVVTSYTQTSGKSSTCNSGGHAQAKALVQENEEVGEIQLEWSAYNKLFKPTLRHQAHIIIIFINCIKKNETNR